MGTVTIVGPGNGGTAAAADLALGGHEVRVWGRDPSQVEPLNENPIELQAPGRQGSAQVALGTTDLAAAVAGADMVFVTVPGYAHRDIANALGDLLQPPQAAVFMPGSFGSFELVRALKRRGVKGVLVGETATLPYGARKRNPTHVVVALRAARLPLGVFPGVATNEVLERAREYWPEFLPARTLLDAGLLNPNVPVHSSLMVTNAGPIEAFDSYDIHAQGTTQSTRRVIDAVDEERIALRVALGYGPPHYEQATLYDPDRQSEGLFGPASFELVTESGEWHEKLTMDHRYVVEDIAQGLRFWVSLGDAFGVPVPVSRAVVQLAATLSGLDFSDGRTVENLGLSDMDVDTLSRLLIQGW